jgi:hypothetical protein
MAGFLATPLAVQVKRDVIAVQVRAEQAVTAVVEQIGMAPTMRVVAKKLPHLKVAIAATLPSLPEVESPPALPQPDVLPSQQAANPVAATPVAASAAPPSRALKEVVLALDPRGEGDPEAVTCRVPQTLPASRLPGPEVCKTNRVWAALRALGQQIAPDGVTLVATVQRFGGQPTVCSASLLLAAPSATRTPFVGYCR